MADRFIKITDVAQQVGLSRTEIYRRIEAGTFPRQVPLGAQRVAFLESEVEAWMAQRLRARDAGEGLSARRERGLDAVSHRRDRK
ncbi:MAG TPA: AlpA family transcriptional regulator [Rhizomicrobium sp.]|jgi:prophage regulatory protein|nr:AlpA family transcriptional regulator [Rhizomicrobium sp.]